MTYGQMYGSPEKDALQAAREPCQDAVVRTAGRFCDNGTPQRYECGASNQRCDSVRITVWLDKTALKVVGQTKEGRELLKELNKIKRRPERTDCLGKQ